jgi:hypothetical protein
MFCYMQPSSGSGGKLLMAVQHTDARPLLSRQAGTAMKATPGWVECAARMLRKEGPLVFVRGLQPTLIRALITESVNFGGYELACKLLHRK